MYSKYGFRSLRPPVCSEFRIKNSKELGPEASGSLRSVRHAFSLQFLIKNNKEITPEASGESGLQFPENSLLKTIRKLLRKPPERLASFFLAISHFKKSGNYSGSLRSLRPPVCPEFRMRSIKESIPEASGVSGLQLPCNPLFKTVRKWVRKPPEASGLQFP